MNADREMLDAAEMRKRTTFAQMRMHRAIAYGQRLQSDPERALRLKAQMCVFCYYTPRVAGQAFTSQACACCDVEQRFGSTDTNALCLECAQQNRLCAHCGGDIDTNTHRVEWPEFGHGTTAQPEQEE